MKAFFYLPESALNEATEYYCKLIEKAFESHEVEISDTPYVEKDIDIIFTIRIGDQNKLKYKNRNKKYIYINWYQGIGPEEYELLHNYSLRAKLGKYYLSYLERRSLKKNDLCLFVSNEMKRFYQKKYSLNLTGKSVIIPCYNKSLDDTSFFVDDKYNKLSFVYAGALYGWQCIEESLQVFKKVYEYDQSASLTLLTGQRKIAENLIKKYDLKNVNIDFVNLEDLQCELKKYKYGFLLRKNDAINNVATPTKMNSYLAAGIIPIYTNVVNDFEENIDLKDHTIKCNLEENTLDEIADKIIDFEKETVCPELIMKVYHCNFINYYSDEKYIQKIKKYLETVV